MRGSDDHWGLILLGRDLNQFRTTFSALSRPRVMRFKLEFVHAPGLLLFEPFPESVCSGVIVQNVFWGLVGLFHPPVIILRLMVPRGPICSLSPRGPMGLCVNDCILIQEFVLLQ